MLAYNHNGFTGHVEYNIHSYVCVSRMAKTILSLSMILLNAKSL